MRKFRNILDSGVIAVDDEVTCLVGMNESGKTAILSALYRLNPVGDAGFNEQQDYPRWLLSRDRRKDLLKEAVPITAEFELDAAEQRLVIDVLGEGVFASETVSLSKRYGDDSTFWDFEHDGQTAVENLLGRSDLRKKTADQFKEVRDLDGIEKVCTALLADSSDGQIEKTTEEVTRIRSELATLPGGVAATTWGVIVATLQPHLPSFFYFSDYSQLDGRIDVSALAEANTEVGSSPAQTARALLRLAETTPAALADDDYEDRKAELEAVGHELTSEVFNYWKQNKNLRVQFDIDRKIEVAETYAQNLEVKKTYLEIRVEDTRHAFTNNFSQRSSGFRWFFSFLAAFTEFESRKEPVVVLLDEPGMTLHGRAQADFLQFINERLAEAVQVIYTTHSPFMVETDKIHRVRIVEDGGPDQGATVTQEALEVREGSLFPLQAALGYDIAQHLFIGSTNLLVEGPSDFVYLDALSRRLTDLGRTGLDEKWRVLPAGGASNIPAFVSLMGQNLDVTVLVDSGTEGADRLDKAVDAARLKRERIIQVSEITGNKHSDVEDMFEIGDYLTLFNKAFSKSIAEADLGPGDRIVKRLEKPYKAFRHHAPADALLRHPDLLDGLGDATLDRFEKLFERINSTLD
ncbi:AAA family ATPase [Microbacterium sp.]|uniref:AAA family ATPase n=1 Tax=Microbacterium sp. TaxID=51671 RepID=UPI002810F2A1|nr:AAA family ATPase [Microbacterium sp.]